MQEEKVEKTLSLSDIWLVIRNNLIWIIAIIIACIGAGIAYVTFVQDTNYTAKVGIYVYAPSTDENGKELNIAEHTLYQYSALIAPEYEKVLKSQEMNTYINPVVNGVKQNNISFSGIKFAYTEDSAFFDITYTYGKHGGDSGEIKKAVAKSLNDYVQKAIEKLNSDEKYGVLRNKLVPYSLASEITVTQSSGMTKTLILSFMVGVVLSAIFVIIMYFIDDTVSSREDIERILGASTIAFIDLSPNFIINEESVANLDATSPENKEGE